MEWYAKWIVGYRFPSSLLLSWANFLPRQSCMWPGWFISFHLLHKHTFNVQICVCGIHICVHLYSSGLLTSQKYNHSHMIWSFFSHLIVFDGLPSRTEHMDTVPFLHSYRQCYHSPSLMDSAVSNRNENLGPSLYTSFSRIHFCKQSLWVKGTFKTE